MTGECKPVWHKASRLDFRGIAIRAFETINYEATQHEIETLTENMMLLENRGLGGLNRRLGEGGRKILDTVAEHNFAVMLARVRGREVRMSYEPKRELHPPADFKIEMEEITYWVQMKRFARSERENRQDTAIRSIARLSKHIKVGRFFACELTPAFSEADVPRLMEYLASVAECAQNGQRFSFCTEGSERAIVEFWSPKDARLDHLTVGFAGDLGMVEVTGVAKEQIRQSLKKATIAYTWKVGRNTINLIVVESDNAKDIDICDALFGTERQKRDGWVRGNDGLFQETEFSGKVAGVIVIKRKEPKPVCEYCMMLYVNEAHLAHLENIKRLMPFEKVIQGNMRPEQANFVC